MLSSEQIRNTAGRLTALRLKKRGIREGTVRWTFSYQAELPRAIEDITKLERPPATDAEILAFTSKSLASLPPQAQKELRAAYQRRDLQRTREIIGRYREATDDAGPEAA